DGYVAVRDVIDPSRLAELRRVTDEFLERSRQTRESDDVFDLDPRHTVEAPALRRIKNPADHHPVYRWVAFESPLPDIVGELLGPDVQFNHSKLNLKGSLIGAPVDWHQDAAFYPHSNDDVLAVGLLLDSTRSPLVGAIVRGAPSRTVRREAGTFRMPPDWSRGYTSIYALQSRIDSR